MEYQYSNTYCHKCLYHVIFCPKYRKKILVNDIKYTLEQILFECQSKYHFKIIEFEIMPDHVHLLIQVDPKFNIVEIVGKIKGYSSYILRKQFSFLNNYKCLWTRSKFICTVGSVSLDTVKKYIQNQNLK